MAGAVAQAITRKLEAALAPEKLAVIDESHRHEGHREAGQSGESHFRVEIVSEQFAGKPRLARQRQVYAVLADELAGPVHALSITALTPEEARGRQ